MIDLQTHTMPKTTLCILTQVQSNVGPVVKLINATESGDHVSVTQGILGDTFTESPEIVIAVHTAGHDVNDYCEKVKILTSMAITSIVIAMVPKDFPQEQIDDSLILCVEQVLRYPMPGPDFSRHIMTHVASLRIKIEREKSLTDLTRNQVQFGELLVENHIISPEQLARALDYQKGADQRLGDLLVLLGFITEEQKVHFLSSQLSVGIASARQYAATDLATVSLIPEHLARRYTCIALERHEKRLRVAMVDVLDLHLLDSLRDTTNLSIDPLLGISDDIQRTIDRCYQDIASQKDASMLIADLTDSVEYVKNGSEELSAEEAAAAGAELGIIKLVNLLIAHAIRDRASDIHIEPMSESLSIRYRIDGELHTVMSPPKRSHSAILTRIKILSDLDIAERRLPQDGRMVAKIGSREVDIRVSILPTVFGEKAVLRILDKEAFEKSVANLGFSHDDQLVFKKNVVKPYGMIIVTGPTGSGKSTTLYSGIQSIKNVTRNIVTVEDPVEFHIEGVNQIQVNNKIGLTFESALRSILRQDPDVILIGEIRDAETADIAVKMALTGHLVFSTLHTNDAASSIARFVDIGIPPLLLASSLNLIIAQRLVRKICANCKVSYTPEDELLEQLDLIKHAAPVFYKGEGCVHCNGIGYLGRCGIFEMMPITKEIRTLILRGAPSMDIAASAEAAGMKTLRQAGIDLALQGFTTIEQIIAATTEL